MTTDQHKQLALAVVWLSILSVSLIKSAVAQNIPQDSLYFGQTPPGDSAVVFAPGIVTITGRNVPCISFSPDGKSAVFYVGFYPNPGTPYCMISSYTNNRWSPPVTASFSAGRVSAEPAFSLDGNRIYMYANGLQNQVGSADLAYSEKTGNAWGTPKSMGNPPNLAVDQYHPCVVADTSIYFSTSSGDIARCQYLDGRYQPRVILPFPVNNANTTQTWGDPYVAPDESYLIFKSTRAGGFGLNDIYISFKKSDGTWTNPKNLGSRINTRYDETSGDITPDGKHMTFGSNNSLYWISTSFIETLRNSNFIPYLKTKPKNQTGEVGASFSFSIPDSTFIDDDGNATLSLFITSRLPDGLVFDTDTRTLSGTPTESGTFTVNLMAVDDADASATTTFSFRINASSGVGDQSCVETIRVYPNPVKDKLHIDFGTETNRNTNILVINTLGKIVLNESSVRVSDTTLDLQGITSGIYYLKLTIDGKVINRKFYLE